MSLLDLWKSDPKQIESKRLEQLISFAGDGKLSDGGSGSTELREFLRTVPLELVGNYAEDCLNKSFKDSGLALQDVVNEVGRRLGYRVTPGRYRGVQNAIGNDGLWISPENEAIVVEVKTTDAYRLDLEKVAEYRRALIANGTIEESTSSMLIVVGRQDTGDLEAQIRGSRHAWDIRLISVDALFRLMKVREDLEDPDVEARTRALLIPREYTRVDEIIDLVFTTTEEVRHEEAPDEEPEAMSEAGDTETRKTPVRFNVACADRIAKQLGTNFVRRSRATFSSADEAIALVCAVSKEYQDPNGVGFWFAFHPHQREFLSRAENGYVGFGCGSPETIVLFPFTDFEPLLEGMNRTVKKDERYYWHVQMRSDGTQWRLARRSGEDWPDISDYVLRGENDA